MVIPEIPTQQHTYQFILFKHLPLNGLGITTRLSRFAGGFDPVAQDFDPASERPRPEIGFCLDRAVVRRTNNYRDMTT
jgi:hypothetical protein